jgi:hypothetical protein
MNGSLLTNWSCIDLRGGFQLQGRSMTGHRVEHTRRLSSFLLIPVGFITGRDLHFSRILSAKLKLDRS